MYRVHGAHHRVQLAAVPVSPTALDPRFVFLLDCGKHIFIWIGRKSLNVARSKARLLAEKMNKVERKNHAEIEQLLQWNESNEFWKALRAEIVPYLEEPSEHVRVAYDQEPSPQPPRLYRVTLGQGYLELPQIELLSGPTGPVLKRELLESKNVYILDCYEDVFIWIGKKSTRLIRAAGLKLAQEMYRLIPRPMWALVTRMMEGTETQIFKTKFSGWDDVMAVDFTRTAESVTRRGIDLKAIMERDQIKTDLAALFAPRQPDMNEEEALDIIADIKAATAGGDMMESFVLEGGKKFAKLPPHEYGHFHSADCYVFLCSYWSPSGDDAATPEEGGDSLSKNNAEESTPVQHTVYFWQGRDASNMGWLTFTFSLQKKFEATFGSKLEIIRMHQQQENMRFLCHFYGNFFIHRGSRHDIDQRPTSRLYQIRSNGSLIW